MGAIGLLGALLLALVGCSAGGGDLADSGGTSGTGLSQGAIDAFGSIFVNGVQWDLSSATVELEGVAAGEADLRRGMVVRVEGDFAPGGSRGTARSVRFDDVLEGPIEAAPVETIPGRVKVFPVLGRMVTVSAARTAFDGGARFATLGLDDVVEVSGFTDPAGDVRATRVRAVGGRFPAVDAVELRGRVSALTKNPDGSGLFDLGTVLVRYDAATVFVDGDRDALVAGRLVEVAGRLRLVGDEIDATRVELETPGFGTTGPDGRRAELEGLVASCPESPDFCVGDVPVDAGGARVEPAGFVPMPGDRVEVEGVLRAGRLVAERIESEEDDALPETARLEGAVASVDPISRSLVLLGVTVEAGPETILEDESSADNDRFRFGDIRAGDYLEVRGTDVATDRVRASSIRREDATPGADDVRLEGPVTALDRFAPSLSILGQVVPIDTGTVYRDVFDQPRSEEQFFRNPGDVALGDVVAAKDDAAADLAVLGEADEVELEGP